MMSEYAGHYWVLVRCDVDRGVVMTQQRESATVRTEVGDALDQFLTNVFDGIQNDCLEVIMSEEADDGQT